jgi:hypothetical protein
MRRAYRPLIRHVAWAHLTIRRLFGVGPTLLLIPLLLAYFPCRSFAACPMGYEQCPRGNCCPSADRCANDALVCIPPGSVYCGGGRSCPAGTECYMNGLNCRTTQTNQTLNQRNEGSVGKRPAVGSSENSTSQLSLACVSVKSKETNVPDMDGGGHLWNNWATPTGAYGCPRDFELVYQDPKTGQATWEVCRGCGSFPTTGGPAVPIRIQH